MQILQILGIGSCLTITIQGQSGQQVSWQQYQYQYQTLAVLCINKEENSTHHQPSDGTRKELQMLSSWETKHSSQLTPSDLHTRFLPKTEIPERPSLCFPEHTVKTRH